MGQHTDKIKQQLDSILKDTKIICELEPFVKKWSLDEMMSNFETSSSKEKDSGESIQDILENARAQPEGISRNVREKLSFKMREIMMIPKGNHDLSQLIPSHQSEQCEENIFEDQYDQELEKTLETLEGIDKTSAVTRSDLEDYVRGLGGKPDGLDLEKTNIREWKNIFLEHWLHWNRLDEPKTLRLNMRRRNGVPRTRQKSSFQTDRICSPGITEIIACASSKANLDSHFMMTKEKKSVPTVVPKSTTDCPTRFQLSPRHSLNEFKNKAENFSCSMSLQNDSDSRSHRASCLRTDASLKKIQSPKSQTFNNKFGSDNSIFHGREQRQMKSMTNVDTLGSLEKASVGRNIQIHGGSKQYENLVKPSVRPSSAVPHVHVKSSGIARFAPQQMRKVIRCNNAQK